MVEAVMEWMQTVQRLVARRRREAHVHPDQVVPLTECRDAERDNFADDRLGRNAPSGTDGNGCASGMRPVRVGWAPAEAAIGRTGRGAALRQSAGPEASAFVFTVLADPDFFVDAGDVGAGGVFGSTTL